ncbi:hypothetical protein [Burkholderia stabilis]|uniref:hypothetical protein n=1 Tax=Burkholderia stabilis TaxID=95485 RepID=UPI001F4AD454|nr:hypothetical protein [Burkholderia stabilis]
MAGTLKLCQWRSSTLARHESAGASLPSSTFQRPARETAPSPSRTICNGAAMAAHCNASRTPTAVNVAKRAIP